MYFARLISIFLILLSFSAFAQPKDLHIFGKTYNYDDEKLNQVTVKIYTEGKEFKTEQTGRRSKFDFHLPYGKNYLLSFQREGYLPKNVTIKAENALYEKIDPYFHFEEWTVTLFEEIEGLDVSFLDEPFGEVVFNQKTGNFNWDAQSLRSAEKRLNALREQAKRLKEEERKAKKMANEDSKNVSSTTAMKSIDEAVEEVPEMMKDTSFNEEKVVEIRALIDHVDDRFPLAVKVKDASHDDLEIEERVASYAFKNDVLFRKVTHPWGGTFYFRNGVSITKFQYEIGSITRAQYQQLTKQNKN